MKKNIKVIILVIFIMSVILGSICLFCSVLPKGTVSKLAISNMYVYNGEKVVDISRNDDIFDLLTEEVENIINMADSENSVIDACFVYTGNGKSGQNVSDYRLLEIHLAEQTNLMLGGIEHQGIKTLVFILDENTVFAYHDDCENESESVVGCSFDSADREKLESIIRKIK